MSVIVVLGITLLCIKTYQKRRYLSVIFFFFFASLLPVLGIIQVGNITHADRWTYLSTLSLFIGIGGGLIWVFEKIEKKNRVWALIPLVAVCIGLSNLSRQQINVWNNDLMFWETVKRFGQDKIPGAYHNIGRIQEKINDRKKATEMYKKALEIQSTFTPSLISLGGVYSEMREYSKAKEYYNKAITHSPKNYRPNFNLALIFIKEENLNAARLNLKQAYKKLKAKNIPYLRDEVKILKLLSGLNVQAKNYQDAVDGYLRLIELNPNNSNSYYMIGQVLLADNQLQKGVGFISKAIEINPNDPKYYFLLGEVYESAAQLEVALQYYKKSEILLPDDKEVKSKIVSITKKIQDATK